MIEYFLVIVTLVYVIAATIFDIKTREVPDWLNFSFIAIAIFTNLLYSLMTKEWIYIIYSLIGLVTFFCLGSLMYYAGQWGGGDAKLLVGLGAIIPIYPKILLNYFNPNLNIPFLVILAFNILIAGGFYGLVFSVCIAIKNKNKFLREFGIILKINKKRIVSVLLILLFTFCLAILFEVSMIVIPFILVVSFIGLTFLFVKAVENSSMYKLIDIKDLTEGDWVVKTIKSRGKIVYAPSLLGITNQEILKLKKYNIKKVLVKDGLPFIPAFLIGLLISLIYGNIFLLIF